MYLSLQSKLGKHFTDSAGYLNVHKYHIIEMYTRATPPELKEKIDKSFSERDQWPIKSNYFHYCIWYGGGLS